MNRIDQYNFKNPIWMASSPFTETFDQIERSIQAGVGGIVLKSISTGIEEVNGKPVRTGKRTVRKTNYPSSFGGKPNERGPSIFSTATNFDIEVLTVNEANELYRRTKEKYPEVVVIQNFEPRESKDFDLASLIEADFIELNTRAYKRSYERPINLMDQEKSKEMFLEGLRIISEFREGIKKIEYPTLLKFVMEPELDYDEQL